ncbi:DUF4190 domain-containing protein [Streptomyces sp. NPDC046203]|uniref:DUF4190 domain-containing protein n=1 Tax=Streptomyces sp. NPDC046203 TaxID=3154602 RepID=UPI0033EA2AB3
MSKGSAAGAGADAGASAGAGVGQAPVPGPYGSPPPGPYGVPGPYTSPMPGPYGPYGTGAVPYGMPPAPQPSTSGLAVASLVSGIVCCLPPLGLVLGLIALPRIKKRQQRGKGLAVTGIVLSAVSSLLMGLGFVTGAFSDFWSGVRDGVREAGSSAESLGLKKGDCFRVDLTSEEPVDDVDKIACTRLHEGEVTGRFKVTGFTGWPGTEAIDEVAEERCDRFNKAYAMDAWALPESAGVYYFAPEERGWKAGDRTVVCGIVTDEDLFTASVRVDETTLDSEQLHYLRTMNSIDDALMTEPEADADEDLGANRKWARAVHRAVTTASSELSGHDWTYPADTRVARLTKDLDEAARSWHQLATAKDADAFWEAYDAAFEGLAREKEVASRSALRLHAVPPADGSEDGGEKV